MFYLSVFFICREIVIRKGEGWVEICSILGGFFGDKRFFFLFEEKFCKVR